jgi:hypothetical protein
MSKKWNYECPSCKVVTKFVEYEPRRWGATRDEQQMDERLQRLHGKVMRLEEQDMSLWGGMFGIRENIHISKLFEILFHYLNVEVKKDSPYPYKLERKDAGGKK